ncbi:serine hydrolase domain-containing protein [Streptosporangium lutulentum]
MREVLTGHVERGDLPGLVTLVARRGEVHVEAIGSTETGGGGPMRRDSIFRIASVTKQITAAAAMILIEESPAAAGRPGGRTAARTGRPQGSETARRTPRRHGSGTPADHPARSADVPDGHRRGDGATRGVSDPAGDGRRRARPGPQAAPIEPDEWMKRLGDLPLVHQPGEKWMYHTGSDVLGVLMARATGRPLEELLKERLFEPLGMKDTGFHVPADKLDRLTASYRPDPGTGALVLDDDPRRSRWGRPPAFPSAGGGLVSTADDLLAFCTMMLNKGRYGGQRILSRPSVELMTTDQLTEGQKAENAVFFGVEAAGDSGSTSSHGGTTCPPSPDGSAGTAALALPSIPIRLRS